MQGSGEEHPDRGRYKALRQECACLSLELQRAVDGVGREGGLVSERDEVRVNRVEKGCAEHL